MKRKPSRPVQILLYVGLAIGLVLVLRLAFGGLTGSGERLRERRAAAGTDKIDVMNLAFMQRAIELAEQNISQGGGPFAAVIVKGGRIVAETGNTVTKSLDPTAHAEVNAIREACRQLQTFDLSGCEIYSSCEPCPMCLSAIYWARLDKLYFAATRQDAAAAGFDDDCIYKEVPLSCGERSLPCVNILREEGKQPFAAWARYEEKIPY